MRDVVGTAVLAIVCGFTRYVHINRLRNDTVLAALLGLGRVVCEDSVRRALKSADERELDAWLARHEKDVFDRLVAYQYVIDIDNTVKPVFGHQEGTELGYNPQKPGRPSHNFHLYFIGSVRISLGVDVLPGKRHSGICGMPRLWEIIDGLPAGRKPRLLRGDVGYGGDENMCEAERRGLTYLFKIKRTKTVLSLFRKMQNDRDWADAGAGLRVDAEKTDLLELVSATFTGAGVIEIAGVQETDVANLKVACAKITGAATGTANLADWTVKVDGEAVPLARCGFPTASSRPRP